MRRSLLRHSLTIAIFAILVGCGKNMAVRLPAPASQNAEGAQNNANTPSVSPAPFPATSPVASPMASATPNVSEGDANNLTQMTLSGNVYQDTGPLQPYSLKDNADTASVLNPSNTNKMINLGTPDFVANDGSGKPNLFFTKGGDGIGTVVTFRGIYQLPPDAAIQSITSVKLILNGLRRYVSPGAAATGLETQVLCLVDPKKCVGKGTSSFTTLLPGFTPGTTDYSSDAMMRINTFQDGGQLLQMGANPYTIDLIKLFPELGQLSGLKGDSVPYADPNFWKMRFAIADQTYFDSGQLQITLQVDPTQMPNGYGNNIGAPTGTMNDAIFQSPGAPTPAPPKFEANAVATPAPTTAPAVVRTKEDVDLIPLISTTHLDAEADIAQGISFAIPDGKLKFETGKSTLKPAALQLTKETVDQLFDQKLSDGSLFGDHVQDLTIYGSADRQAKRADANNPSARIQHNKELSGARAKSFHDAMYVYAVTKNGESSLPRIKSESVALGEPTADQSKCGRDKFNCEEDRRVTFTINLKGGNTLPSSKSPEYTQKFEILSLLAREMSSIWSAQARSKDATNAEKLKGY